MIDLRVLPQKAQDELLDFYQFLVDRYSSGKRKKSSPRNTAKEVNRFFDQYNINLTNFIFHRDELYDR
jgi:hypothetical protein